MLRYKEVKLMLKEMIAGMSNGERLPARTVLIKRLDSSRATVDKAIRELELEGVLESRFGSGTFVARRLEGVVSNAENWCLIVPDISEALYAKLASGVENAARERNANVILCNSESSAEKQAEYISRLILAGIDGFIIVPVVTQSVTESIILYRSLQQSRIPFVFCNREVEGVSAPIIKSNDFYGGYIATLHLIDHGYRGIAYLARQRYRTSIDRCQGSIAAQQHRGLEIERERILMIEDGSVEDCGRQLEALLRSQTPVDAVFCFNDIIAFEAMRTIKALGLKVSEDIGLIGYDSLDACARTEPPLTSVAYKAGDIGRMAARVLGKCIDGRCKGGFAYWLMEPEITVKASCLGKAAR